VVKIASIPNNAAQMWIGLKNSDDQGTQFDLHAELYKNGNLIMSGTALCVTGVTRNPNLAKVVNVPFGATTDGDLVSGDLLSLKLSTRIGTNPDGSKCAGPGGSHSNATGLRLYYDSVPRYSGFSVEITPDPLQSYYLHSTGALFFNATEPTGASAKTKDSAGINFAGGNPGKEIGTWNRTIP
jgi:hypothetical protein